MQFGITFFVAQLSFVAPPGPAVVGGRPREGAGGRGSAGLTRGGDRGGGVHDVARVHVIPLLLILLDDEVPDGLSLLEVKGGATLVIQPGVNLQWQKGSIIEKSPKYCT